MQAHLNFLDESYGSFYMLKSRYTCSEKEVCVCAPSNDIDNINLLQ